MSSESLTLNLARLRLRELAEGVTLAADAVLATRGEDNDVLRLLASRTEQMAQLLWDAWTCDDLSGAWTEDIRKNIWTVPVLVFALRAATENRDPQEHVICGPAWEHCVYLAKPLAAMVDTWALSVQLEAAHV